MLQPEATHFTPNQFQKDDTAADLIQVMELDATVPASEFHKSELKIPSKTPGWDLDVWRYLPVSSNVEGLPLIIMRVAF